MFMKLKQKKCKTCNRKQIKCKITLVALNYKVKTKLILKALDFINILRM